MLALYDYLKPVQILRSLTSKRGKMKGACRDIVASSYRLKDFGEPEKIKAEVARLVSRQGASTMVYTDDPNDKKVSRTYTFIISH